jgi:hypothetical protein
MKNTKHCINCGKTYKKNYYSSIKRWRKSKFCSIKCKHLWGKPEKICPVCGKKFNSWRHQNHTYCSKLCGNRSRKDRGGRVELTCKNCGKSFVVKKSRKEKQNPQFCSKDCYEKYGHEKMRGLSHWNWKGGVNRKNHRRETKQYKEWRLSVYRRDHFKCQDCGKHCNQKNIVAHHLKGWSKYPKLRYEISNGITLCRKCHRLRHKRLIR